MEENIKQHSGSKYVRRIVSCVDFRQSIEVDVYAMITACDVRCPAIAHAIKKLLCTGIRGKADFITDLNEARDAITRAIQLHAGATYKPNPAPAAPEFSIIHNGVRYVLPDDGDGFDVPAVAEFAPLIGECPECAADYAAVHPDEQVF